MATKYNDLYMDLRSGAEAGGRGGRDAGGARAGLHRIGQNEK